jgi:uncharacterized protein (UPF0333 family)
MTLSIIIEFIFLFIFTYVYCSLHPMAGTLESQKEHAPSHLAPGFSKQVVWNTHLASSDMVSQMLLLYQKKILCGSGSSRPVSTNGGLPVASEAVSAHEQAILISLTG